MLTLTTGKPGASKTLNTLYRLEQDRKRQAAEHAKDPTKPSPRPIYYHGIPELTLDGWIYWEDPKRWQDLPAGAILVVDEAQNHFPVRKKDDAPAYVTELSKHRHYGIDLELITQDPMLVDVWLRRLVGRHFHVVRPWGLELSVIYEWQQVTDLKDFGALKQALITRRKFPKEFYGVYKSADLHTKPVRPPYHKLAVIGLAAIAAITLGTWATIKVLSFDDTIQDTETAKAAQAAAVAAAAADTRVAAADLRAAAADLSRLAEQFQPAVKGLPWSAPFYSEHLRPETMPIIYGCSRIKFGLVDRCRCEDQQGTPVDMSREQCIAMMERPQFDWSGEREAYRDKLIAELEARQSAGGGFGRSSVGQMAQSSSQGVNALPKSLSAMP